MTKRVILWTCPRSLSTVFYRSISTLSNTRCWYELFGNPYCFGPVPDRKTSKVGTNFVPDGLECEPTYAAVKALFLKDYDKATLLFTKEMAYCLPEHMRHEYLETDIIHTFLIRDPDRAVYSFYKLIASKNLPGYEELDIEETVLSYCELHKMFSMVKEHLGKPPVVVNAADLQAYPDETMRSYCDAVGIQFEPHMTTWEPGPVPGPDLWVDYQGDLRNSTGFIRTRPEEPIPLDQLPKNVVDCIDKCRPSYASMLPACIKPF